jgi:hypothetical protein
MTQLEYGIGGSLQGIEDASGRHLTGLEFWWSSHRRPVLVEVSLRRAVVVSVWSSGIFRRQASPKSLALYREKETVVGFASAFSSLFSSLSSPPSLFCRPGLLGTLGLSIDVLT